MRKYRVEAGLYQNDKCSAELIDNLVTEIFAEDEADLEQQTVQWYREILVGMDDCFVDDVRWKDLGAEMIFIRDDRNSYVPERKSLTVGELIKMLEEYDSDSPINLVCYNSFGPHVYSTLNSFSIDAESELCEEEY